MDLKKSIQIAEQYLGEQYFSSLNISFVKNEDLNTFKLCKEQLLIFHSKSKFMMPFYQMQFINKQLLVFGMTISNMVN